MEGVKELVESIHEAVDTARKVALAVGYSEGAAASKARIDELQRELHAEQDLLRNAELRWQRDIVIVEQETIERCAAVCDERAKDGPESMTTEAMLCAAHIRDLAPRCDRAMQEAAA